MAMYDWTREVIRENQAIYKKGFSFQVVDLTYCRSNSYILNPYA